MSNQPQSSPKNWLYFAYGSGATFLIVTIVFGILNFNKSVQTQGAGTWKVEAVNASGTPPITFIISPEGKIFALNPQNNKESVEIGKITKISDVATLPEGGKSLQADPFTTRSTKSNQSEAKTYVGSLNRGQQAYFLEKNNWGQNIDILAIGIKSETENYKYSTQIINSIKTINTKNDAGIALQRGISKNERFKSYVGVAYLLTTQSGEITSLSILCESNEPTTKESGLPKFDGKEMQCPDGYTSLN